MEIVFSLIVQGEKKGAVSKWLKQAMRGSAFFRNIFGQAKTECRKNGTQGIIFIRNSKWNELWNLRTSYSKCNPTSILTPSSPSHS